MSMNTIILYVCLGFGTYLNFNFLYFFLIIVQRRRTRQDARGTTNIVVIINCHQPLMKQNKKKK